MAEPTATVYPVIPEPCDDCPTGLAWMECHDGRYRCQNCVHAHARSQGLDTDWTPRPAPPVAEPAAVHPVEPTILTDDSPQHRQGTIL